MRPSRRQMPTFTRSWPSGHPSATAVLIALIAAVASAQWLFGFLDHGEILRNTALTDWLGLSASGVEEGRFWQFFSFPLLHAGPFPLHLLVNLVVLYFAGRELEPIIGTKHFLALFFAGNLLGGVMHWVAGTQGWIDPDIALMGVSAGVVAIVTAYATTLPELETDWRFFSLPVRIPSKFLGLGITMIAGALWATQTALPAGPEAMLTGALVGWVYTKELGFGSPLAIQRFLFDRRQREARLQRMPLEQFISQEIDPILDKIAREGLASLSRAERRVLEKGREKLTSRHALT